MAKRGVGAYTKRGQDGEGHGTPTDVVRGGARRSVPQVSCTLAPESPGPQYPGPVGETVRAQMCFYSLLPKPPVQNRFRPEKFQCRNLRFPSDGCNSLATVLRCLRDHVIPLQPKHLRGLGK